MSLPASLPFARTLLDYAACSIILCQTEHPNASSPAPFRISLLNRFAEDLTGYSTTELEGKPLHHILTFPAPDWANTTPPAPIDCWLTLRDGNRMKQSVRILPTPDGIAMTFETHPATESRVSVLGGIAAHSPNGLVVYQAVRAADGTIDDYRTLFYNPRVLEITGYTETELQQQTLFERQPDGKRFADTFRQVVETGHESNWEYFNPRLGRWFEVLNRQLGDGFFTSFRDITQLIEARQQIQEQAGLLERVLNTSRSGLLVYEAVRNAQNQIDDFRVTMFNEAAQAIGRFAIPLKIGLHLTELYPNTKVEGSFNRLAEATETRESFQTEFYYKDLDEWYYLSVAPLGDGCVVSFIKLTESKRTEAHIRQTAELLQAVMDAANGYIVYCEAVWETGSDGSSRVTDFIYRHANAAISTLIGRPREQILGERMTRFFPSVKEIGLFERYARVVEQNTADSFEFPYETDGYNGWFLISAIPLQAGFVLSFVDITASKQAALQLQQQHDLLDGVMNSSIAGITVSQAVHHLNGDLLDFRVVLTNEIALRLALKNRADVVGKTFTEIYPKTKETGLWTSYGSVYQTGQSVRIEHFNPELARWFDVSISKLGDGLVITFIDITVRKESELEVWHTSQLMQNMLQSVPTGIVLYEALRDNDGRITDFIIRQINQMASSLTGLRPDNLIGKPMWAVLPSYHTLGLFDQALELMETGQAQRSEIHYTLDGQDRWLDISGVKHEDGLLVSFLDSTDRKRAELSRLEQTTFLDQLLQTSPYAIIAYQAIREPGPTDRPGPITDLKAVFHNTAYETVFAVTADEIYHRTFQQRLTEEQNPGLLKRYIELIETGQPLRREHFYPHLNKWLDVSITRLGDGLLAVMLDITDRKRTEEERQQQARQLELLNQELQRSNQALEQFAYVASHDLREPLRKIQAFGNLLTDQYGPVLGTNGVDWLRRMQDAASRMADLIQDLLAYSRLTGRQEPFVRVDLNELLKDILNDLETVIRDKQGQVTVEPLPQLTGSPLQLRQLFQNLLSNALKFSKTGEPPRVTIRVLPPEEWESSLPEKTSPATWAALRISDNGIGFDERYSQRIFELFQRLHGRTQYSGTGIGLAIARKVIDNHGGWVHVRSRPNHGTSFTIYLPLSPKPKTV